MPASKDSKKYKATNKHKVIERQYLVNEDDTVAKMHQKILDITTPLKSQGVSSITFKQIKDQLQNDIAFQGLSITDDLISQALEGIPGMNAAADMSNGGAITITFDNQTKSPASQAQTAKADKSISQAATRQATKDL